MCSCVCLGVGGSPQVCRHEVVLLALFIAPEGSDNVDDHYTMVVTITDEDDEPPPPRETDMVSATRVHGSSGKRRSVGVECLLLPRRPVLVQTGARGKFDRQLAAGRGWMAS